MESEVSNLSHSMTNPSQSDPASGSVVQNQMNEKFLGVNIHTRPMGVHSSRLGAVTATEHDVICEPGWNVMNWAQRPQVVSSVQWASTATSHTSLFTLDLPSGLLTTTFAATPFNSFLYWRGDIELHLQTSGTPFHQGTIIMYYVPLSPTGGSSVATANSSFAVSTGLQHTILHANASTSACMTIPFISPNSYLNIKDGFNFNSSLGTLKVEVFNPLQAATGASASINVSLIAQFKNSSFKIPRTQAPLVAQGLIEKIFGKSGGRILQDMLPENVIADTVDSALGIIGLDKPSSIERGCPMKMVGTQYMNSSSEIDYLDKFSLFPGKLQMTTPITYGVDNNECEFSYLKKKYTYFGTFSQSITQTPGKLLCQFPISPVVVPLQTTSPATPYNQVANYVPLLEYITLPFQYWKGGLNFKIQVVATSFHNTKIFAAVKYGVYTAAGDTTVADASNQYGFAFEVNQGATEFEFTVPYVAQRHQLYVPGGDDAGFQYSDKTAMGSVAIYVLNELAVSNNVPSTIAYNLFIAGAEDYCVNTIGCNNLGCYAQNNTATTFVAQSIISPLIDQEISTDQNVISPKQKICLRNDVNERSITSIMEPLKKYNLISVIQPTINENYTTGYFELNSIFRIPVYTTVSALNPSAYSLPRYLSTMYRGYRGPMRIKIIVESFPIGYSMKIIYAPPHGSATDAISGLTDPILASFNSIESASLNENRPGLHVAYINSTSKTAEIELPYTTSFNFSLIDKSSQNGRLLGPASELGIIMYAISNDTPATSTTFKPRINLYVAYGDETKLGVFTGTPYVEVAAIPGSTTPVYPGSWTSSIPATTPFKSITVL